MSKELKPCRCGGKADVSDEIGAYPHRLATCDTCSVSARVDDWNRIMDTSKEDELRAELSGQTGELQRLKDKCMVIVRFGSIGTLGDLLEELKGML